MTALRALLEALRVELLPGAVVGIKLELSKARSDSGWRLLNCELHYADGSLAGYPFQYNLSGSTPPNEVCAFAKYIAVVMQDSKLELNGQELVPVSSTKYYEVLGRGEAGLQWGEITEDKDVEPDIPNCFNV